LSLVLQRAQSRLWKAIKAHFILQFEGALFHPGTAAKDRPLLSTICLLGMLPLLGYHRRPAKQVTSDAAGRKQRFPSDREDQCVSNTCLRSAAMATGVGCACGVLCTRG
jgi:hypothetical protein